MKAIQFMIIVLVIIFCISNRITILEETEKEQIQEENQKNAVYDVIGQMSKQGDYYRAGDSCKTCIKYLSLVLKNRCLKDCIGSYSEEKKKLDILK